MMKLMYAVHPTPDNGGMRDLAVTSTVVVPEHELTWRFSRSSGPGGQSVNTADSRVELSVDVARTTALSALLRQRALGRLADRLVDGVVTVTASEHRSQLRNREAALTRMAELLREAIAPPAAPRKRTRPTKAAKERRLTAKKHRGQIKRLRRPTADD
jgi:ribosome-associated protein